MGLPMQLCRKSTVCLYVGLFLDSLFWSINLFVFRPAPHCCTNCCFITSLKIRPCCPSNVFLFQSCLGQILFVSTLILEPVCQFPQNLSGISIWFAVNLLPSGTPPCLQIVSLYPLVIFTTFHCFVCLGLIKENFFYPNEFTDASFICVQFLLNNSPSRLLIMAIFISRFIPLLSSCQFPSLMKFSFLSFKYRSFQVYV